MATVRSFRFSLHFYTICGVLLHTFYARHAHAQPVDTVYELTGPDFKVLSLEYRYDTLNRILEQTRRIGNESDSNDSLYNRVIEQMDNTLEDEMPTVHPKNYPAYHKFNQTEKDKIAEMIPALVKEIKAYYRLIAKPKIFAPSDFSKYETALETVHLSRPPERVWKNLDEFLNEVKKQLADKEVAHLEQLANELFYLELKIRYLSWQLFNIVLRKFEYLVKK